MLEELCNILEPSVALKVTVKQQPVSIKRQSALGSIVRNNNAEPETPENIQKLKTALTYLDPNVERGDTKDIDFKNPENSWLMVIWAIASLNWSCGKELACEWSKQSDKYVADEFENDWDAYNPLHPNPIGIGSLYKLAYSQGYRDTEPQVESFGTSSVSPLSLLRSHSATGTSQQMREKMLSDKFVMQDIAILGQWTTLYAAPNTGKTLLTLWLLREQIQAGVISGSKVFYVNADDTYKGAVQKTEIAESLGMEMLIPNIKGFDARGLVAMLRQLAQADEARGVVAVLDTLKKFTDLMDKRVASAFGTVAREFISAGGTLICLAHTNKHKDAEGKGIYSGTSDIVDDSDCVYIIDKISCDEATDTHTVEFVNKKARGDVSPTASFEYTRTSGESYTTLLNSVKRLNSGVLEVVKKKAVITKQLEDDHEVIQEIRHSISLGTMTKSGMIAAVHKETGVTHHRVREILKRHTGHSYADGSRWVESKGENNKSEFVNVDPPSIFT
jgi:hypothetical protein